MQARSHQESSGNRCHINLTYLVSTAKTGRTQKFPRSLIFVRYDQGTPKILGVQQTAAS